MRAGGRNGTRVSHCHTPGCQTRGEGEAESEARPARGAGGRTRAVPQRFALSLLSHVTLSWMALCIVSVHGSGRVTLQCVGRKQSFGLSQFFCKLEIISK